MMWFLVEKPAPVLNTPHFSHAFGGSTGSELPRNQNNHPIHNEFVALPGMSFPVTRSVSDTILQIFWQEYGPIPLYIDKRFGNLTNKEPPSLAPQPLNASLLPKMEQWLGAPYMWGGNWSEGIPTLLNLYPPKNKLDTKTEALWTFKGVDCSGLLFQATGGTTPRNTSHLLTFGNPLPINPLNIKQIRLLIEPLDMVIYPGHVLFVRDKETIIESKSPFGVRFYPLELRLEELQAEQRAFSIRRFIS